MKKALLLSLLLMTGYASAAEYPQELLMKWKNPEARAMVAQIFKDEKPTTHQQIVDLVNLELGKQYIVYNEKLDFYNPVGDITSEEFKHLILLKLDFERFRTKDGKILFESDFFEA